MDLAALTLATFEPLVGETFALHAGTDEPLALTLTRARRLGARPGGRDPFGLDFRGPRDPLLPQAIYRVEHASLGALEIFIVPVDRDADGVEYEAVFT